MISSVWCDKIITDIMKNIPENVKLVFVGRMRTANIEDSLQRDYLKWLRFYLDFCEKYKHESKNENSLAFFVEKLRNKNQSENNIKQAKDSVRVYLSFKEGLDHSKQEINGNNLIMVNEANSFEEWNKIIERLNEEIRLRNFSKKTFSAYSNWIRQFGYFLSYKKPSDVVMSDVKKFLTHLAVDKNVAATTQNQAFNSLLFLFRNIFNRADEFDATNGIVRAKRKKYIPVVLSREEIDLILSKLRHPYKLIVQLLYGCGLRISEALNLRVQCLNFDEDILTVHDGKGLKDRCLPIPQLVKPALIKQINLLRKLHDEDLKSDYDGTFMPGAIDKKFKNCCKDFPWQWFFPAKTITLIPETGERKRYHLHESHVQKAIRSAVKRCKLTKRATAHTFRHSFASHLLQANFDIRTIQKMMGHSDVRTTMIYTQTVKSKTIKEQRSPLDL